MTFEEANEILDDGNYENGGTKLVISRPKGKLYLVSISTDAGDVYVYEVDNSSENWARIAETFAGREEDEYDPTGQCALKEAIEDNATHIVSTAFWG